MPTPTLPTFFHQPTTIGPSNNIYRNLCAFYAIRHFLGERGADGYLPKNDFIKQAVEIYTTALGLPKEEPTQMANAGNDPAVVDRYLPNPSDAPPHDLAKRTKILIALKDRPHFITVLKVGQSWYDYDSLHPEPILIHSIETFIKTNSGHRYWSS